MLAASKWFTVVLVAAYVFAGCTQNDIYRTNTELCVTSRPDAECRDRALQEIRDPARPDARYLLGFVEFDDQGQVFDRNKMRVVVDQLAGRSGMQDILMVVFVHGWKHSAAAGDGNIDTFRQELARLSELESAIGRKTGEPAREVVGVFLGWRGGSLTLPGVQELTFWDRKNTAHKVGHGGVTEVVSRLEQIRKTKDAIVQAERKDPRARSRTRLVVVGHSFGGALVYSALSQVLMTGFVDTVGPDGTLSDVRGFGNLVVLINPAFEAARFTPLSDMANERGSYFPTQLPVIAILTSEADDATKRAFPIGRWFSTFFEKHRLQIRKNGVTGEDEEIDQQEANITAVGHFEPYRTHWLRTAAGADAADAERASVKASLDRFAEVSDRWENDAPGSVIEFEGSILERTKTSVSRNPYLVIRVDRQLINNHNHINDARITSFIRQLILIAGQSEELQKRRTMRAQTLAE